MYSAACFQSLHFFFANYGANNTCDWAMSPSNCSRGSISYYGKELLPSCKHCQERIVFALLQISKLNDDKRALMDQIEDLEKQLKRRDEENARLRKDNEQLREEVPFKSN